MLAKLIKYEFKATYKFFCTFYIGLFAMALLTILTTKFDVFNNFILSSIRTILAAGFIVGLIATPFATIIYIAYRFYKKLFTDEGYLTFTLPATRFQIVFSKYVTSILWLLVSTGAIALSIFIVWNGIDILKASSGLVRFLVKDLHFSLFHGKTLVFVSFLFYIFADALYVVSFIYLAIACGQFIFPKHKIIGALLSYLLIQMVQQILSGIILAIYMVSVHYSLSSNSLPDSYYLVFGLVLIGATALWLFLTTLICKKKLNLS